MAMVISFRRLRRQVRAPPGHGVGNGTGRMRSVRASIASGRSGSALVSLGREAARWRRHDENPIGNTDENPPGGGVHGQATGIDGGRHRLQIRREDPRHAQDGGHGPFRRNFSNDVVGFVTHVDVAGRIHNKAVGLVEARCSPQTVGAARGTGLPSPPMGQRLPE